MKLLVVQGAAERGGAERVLLTLTRGLAHHGITPIIGFMADGPFVAEVAQAGVRHVTLGSMPRARDLGRAGDVVDAIRRGIVSTGADVVLANGEKPAPYACWASRATGTPVVTWLHDAPLRDGPSAALQLALRATVDSAAVVAPSAWMAHDFRMRLGLHTQLIRHGIELDRLPPRGDIRAPAQWDASSFVVALFGRLQHWKGADVFLRAGARLIHSGRDLRMALIGGSLYGWEEDFAASLPALARELGIEDRCWFAGHRDDAQALMGSADVVVHCSRRDEPLGLVVPEAMAMGRPVIATRTRGPEEVIDHGRTGLLVAPEDDLGTACAIARLMEDPVETAAMAEAGAAEVVRRWSAPAMVESFARLIKEKGKK